jgi:hypothetical protein
MTNPARHLADAILAVALLETLPVAARTPTRSGTRSPCRCAGAATGVADDKSDQPSFADRVQERSGEGLQEGAGGEAALRVLTGGPRTDHA